MDWQYIHLLLVQAQKFVSFCGVFIILLGILMALGQYFSYLFMGKTITDHGAKLNGVRLTLGRTLILGLEFIIAADLIGTTTTPDYYALGILAVIVMIRTLLSFSLNKELQSLSKEK